MDGGPLQDISMLQDLVNLQLKGEYIKMEEEFIKDTPSALSNWLPHPLI